MLTLLVGNTNSRLAWFRDRRLVRRRVVPTRQLIDALRRIPEPRRTPLAVASVVPALVPAIRHLSPAGRTFVFGPASATGLAFRYSRRQVGADRLCAVAGARTLARGNLLVVDFGTAVTMNAVTAQGVFLGGPIVPGARLMLASLHAGTAGLPLVGPTRSARVMPRDTCSALRSGAHYLLVFGIRGMARAIAAATGLKFRLIATGGAARLLAPAIGRNVRVEPDLASIGLAGLTRLNRPQWFP